MKKKRKRWMAAVLAMMMLVICICADTDITANAAAKKAGASVSIANLPEGNVLSLDPEDENTYSYDFNARKRGADVVYFEVKNGTNTAGVNSSKSGIVYPATAGSFEIRAVAFASAADREKWLDARKANGYVADPKAEKYIAAVSDWSSITVTTNKENEGLGVARSQTSLNKVLKNKKVTNLVIWTNEERSFTIANKNYKNKTLTVKTPNAEVINAGRFDQINVEQIKTSTFTERAKGNRFHVTALNARIIVEKGARVLGITYQPNIENTDIAVEGFFHFNLVVHGTVNLFDIAPQRKADVLKTVKPTVKIEADANANISEVKISEASDVTVEGEKQTPINLTVEESAAGTALTAKTPVKADLSADTTITLAESAKNSELTVSKKAEVEVKTAEADKTVEDVTVKVAKEAKGAKVSLFVKVVVEIGADITLTGTAKEESKVVVTEENVKVTDEDGNVIETDTDMDMDTSASSTPDSSMPDSSNPNPPATPVPGKPNFSGKLIWSVGDSESGTITKDSPNPITIKLSADAVSGSAISFLMYAADQPNYTVNADKSHLEGASTKVKVTVMPVGEKDHIVAEYIVIFTMDSASGEPSEDENMPVVEIVLDEMVPITSDINSIIIDTIKQEYEGNFYEITVTIPVAKRHGHMTLNISAKGYETVNEPYSADPIGNHTWGVILKGNPDLNITIIVEIGEFEEEELGYDVRINAGLRGTLVVSGSAVMVSGTAITMDVDAYGHEPQIMQFTENEDGSITGEFQIHLWSTSQRIKITFEPFIENTDVEYIWKKDGEVISDDLIEMEDPKEQTLIYSVTIKAK